MRKNVAIGNSLISSGLTSGFQLEDFDRHSRVSLIYGHDNKRHLAVVQKNISGKQYPRLSFYRWNPEWHKGDNTTIFRGKLIGLEAKARESYIQTNKVTEANRYIKKRAVRGMSKHAIGKSWFVPDVRIYGDNRPRHDFRSAFLVTKNIDSNSRMAMLVTNKRKLSTIRKRLKGEQVRRVKVQNYRNSKNSFYSFIS